VSPAKSATCSVSPGVGEVDMAVQIGTVALPNPVMTASGTSGHGAELAAYGDLSRLGAVVVKSVAAFAWPGNPAPRLVPLPVGMLNSVGLQGLGLDRWLDDDLPALLRCGARTVVSVWGRSAEEFAEAGRRLVAGLGQAALRSPNGVVAVEANISCPNLEDRARMFAHSAEATRRAIGALVEALGPSGLPVWAKLSPNVTDLVSIARAALDSGAEALVLVNTLMGLALDRASRRPQLGAGGGGISGPALHPVAVRAVSECRRALPGVPIIGAGGVMTGRDAADFLAGGANAVQVGTAIFLDPRSPWRVGKELEAWCRQRGFKAVADI